MNKKTVFYILTVACMFILIISNRIIVLADDNNDEDVWSDTNRIVSVSASYGDYCKRCGHCLGDIESYRCYQKKGFYIVSNFDQDARVYLDEVFSTDDSYMFHNMFTDMSKNPVYLGVEDPNYDYTKYSSEERCPYDWGAISGQVVYKSDSGTFVYNGLPEHTIPEIARVNPELQISCKKEEWDQTVSGGLSMKYTGKELRPEVRVVSDGKVLDKDDYVVYFKNETNERYNLKNDCHTDWVNPVGTTFKNYLYSASDPVPVSDQCVEPGIYSVIIRFTKQSKFRGIMRIYYQIAECPVETGFYSYLEDGTFIFLYKYNVNGKEYFCFKHSSGVVVENTTIKLDNGDIIKVGSYNKTKGYDYYEKISSDGSRSTEIPTNSGSNSSSSNKYSNEWVDGKWYNSDGTQTYKGTMQWKKDAIGWWIEDTDGWYPKNQWQKIDGKWYYFCADGYMDYSEYRDGCWLNADGSWNESYSGGHWIEWSPGSGWWWYTDNTGYYPNSGSCWIDGHQYQFDADGWTYSK